MNKKSLLFIIILMSFILFACAPQGQKPTGDPIAETITAMDIDATRMAIEMLNTQVAEEEAVATLTNEPATGTLTELTPALTAGLTEAEDIEGLFGPYAVNPSVKVEETSIYSTEEVKVTIKSLGFNASSGPELLLWVENTSTNDLQLSVVDLVINGFMMNNTLVAVIPAGTQQDLALTVASFDLACAGIETIQYIEFALRFDESQTLSRSITTERIRLNTNAAPSSAPALVREGALLMEREGIRVSLMRYKSPDHFAGARFFLLAENNTDIDIQLATMNIQVDGQELDLSHSVNLLQGMKAVKELSFSMEQTDSLDDNRVETISFYLKVSRKDHGGPLFTSDLIEINFDQP